MSEKRPEELPTDFSAEAPETPTPEATASEETVLEVGSVRPHSKTVARLGLVMALVMGVVGGVWLGSQQAWEDPYASCEASAELVDEYVAAMGAVMAAKVAERPELAESPRRHLWELGSGFGAVEQVFDRTTCDPVELFGLVDFENHPEPLRTVLAHLAATVGNRYDIPTLFEQAERIRQVQFQPGKPRPQVVPTELVDGNTLIVYADEACECFDDIAANLESWGGEVEVFVADEGEASRAVARAHGWKLIEAASVAATELVDERPAVVLTRSGVVVDMATGADSVSHAPGVGVLEYPLDPAAESVHTRLITAEMACDGHRAGGVIINHTDRPVHVIVITDPNVGFTEEGLPDSRRREHDLGVVGAYQHTFFEVATGENFYAPCWVSYDAVYADGEWRGLAYEPGPAPEGFEADAAALLERAPFEMPVQVKPQGVWPAPSDVTPVPAEERMR